MNQHTAHSIIHSPACFTGLEWITTNLLWAKTGAIKLLLGHLWLQDQTKNLLVISMGHTQLKIGMPIYFFNLPYQNYVSWIEPAWFISIWQFLDTTNCNLTIHNQWLPKLAHTNDQMLTALFLSLWLSNTELWKLNQCRSYLQVLTVAEIVSSDGTYIESNV